MKPYTHQHDAVAWAWPRRSALLHHGMGAGKTRSALMLVQKHLDEVGGSRILVCCPKAVIPAWVKQCGLWAPDLRVLALTNGTAKDKEKLISTAWEDPSPLVVVVNYETAWRIKSLEKRRWDIVVYDEIHKLKSPGGAASRWAARLGRNNPKARRIGLTGTLLPHSILDAQPIFRSLESPDCTTFDRTITAHRERYAIMNPHQPGMVLGWKNLDDAHARIAANTHHVKSEDVLDLPPIQYEDVQVELTPPEARLYRQIEDEFAAVCEAGTVTPTNALVKLLRLQQICGGSVRYDGDPVARSICPQPAKRAALADMLDCLPLPEPVVIFCRFTSDIANAIEACRQTGRTTSELSGRSDDLEAWQMGHTAVLVAQIQSGGIGIDLTRASYAAFFSLGYSLAEYLQAVARLHRPGQANRTCIYHLIATARGRRTVDGRVYQAIRERKDVVDAIISGFSHDAQ